MSRALSSELLKLRTTRTTAALVGSALLLVFLIVGIASAAGGFSDEPHPGRDLLSIASLTPLFALVLGILAFGSEFRHGTITPSLLVTPDRVRVLVAKLVVHALAGLLLGLVTVVVALALIAGIFSVRDIETGLSGSEAFESVLGMALANAIYAALGVGIGALIRNQVGAIVGSLAYIFVVEQLIQVIPGVDTAVEKFGFNGLTSALSLTTGDGSDTLSQVPAGLLLTVYAAIFLIAGAAVLRRRDVSA